MFTVVLPLTSPWLPPPKTLPHTTVLSWIVTIVEAFDGVEMLYTVLWSPPPYTLPVLASPGVPITLLPLMVRLTFPFTVPRVVRSSLV